MKKLLLIFGIIAIVSAIAFGCTVAVFGVSDNNWSLSIAGTNVFSGSFSFGGGFGKIKFKHGDTVISFNAEQNKEYKETFDGKEINEIDISLSSAETTIRCDNVEDVTVNYTTGNIIKNFYAELSDGKLKVKEDSSFILNFLFFSGRSARLEIILPEKEYKSVKLNHTSGDMKVKNLVADNMTASMTSGNGSYYVFARDMKFTATSGDMYIENCTNRRAESIYLSGTSGDRTISGFLSDRYELKNTSGNLKAFGISGDVTLKSTSGSAQLKYAEWDGDLKINMTSGGTSVILPDGSGAELNYNCTSGGIDVNLGGERADLSKNGTVFVGGENAHNINVSMTSGGLSIND